VEFYGLKNYLLFILREGLQHTFTTKDLCSQSGMIDGTTVPEGLIFRILGKSSDIMEEGDGFSQQSFGTLHGHILCDTSHVLTHMTGMLFFKKQIFPVLFIAGIKRPAVSGEP